MKPSDAGSSGGHGVIQIHSTDWLRDDDAADDDHTQPSPPSHSLTSNSDSSSTTAAATSSRPRRVPVRPPAQPFQPKTKKATSYTDRYAAIVPPPQLPPHRASSPQPTEELKESLEPPYGSLFPPASHSDILVVAPFTPLHPTSDPHSSLTTPPPCLDESSLALRYPDYFPSLHPGLPPSLSPTPASPSSSSPSPSPPPPPPPSFTPYTLSDFRTLPREVRLTSLGSSVDPAQLDATRRKRRERQQLELQVRQENARRIAMQRDGGERKGGQEEGKEAKEVRLSARERAKAFAASVPKPKATPPPPAQVERLIMSGEEEKQGRRRGAKADTPSSKAAATRKSGSVAPAAAGASSVPSLDALLARQEDERRAVQQIRQALRL